MNEIELAEAIASGAAPSPSKFGNSQLVALRISGTGSATRHSERHSERVYRSPQIWLSPETQARVVGMSVVADHPEDDLLDGESFALTALGSIIHSYIGDRCGFADPTGPDLWGIGRLFVGPKTMAALASGSTSPAVSFTADSQNQMIELPDGTPCLCEGNPASVDHLAIVTVGAGGAGVWDLGDPNERGIRIDNPKENIVTEEETAAAARADAEQKDREDRARKDAEGAAGMDKVMSALAAISTRLDSLEAKPATKSDAKSEEKDDDQDENTMSDNERSHALIGVQARADAVCQLWGQRAKMAMSGESPIRYRQRMLRWHQQHSPAFRDTDLSVIARDKAAFKAVEDMIFADSEKASRNPGGPADGQMVSRKRTTDSGHTIIEWHGNETVFKQFSTPPMYATAFLVPQNRGQ